MIRDTYAATLAARSFRVFMAIAARFDLELIQYDAVNAFVHAKLSKTIQVILKRSFKCNRHSLLLIKPVGNDKETLVLVSPRKTKKAGPLTVSSTMRIDWLVISC